MVEQEQYIIDERSIFINKKGVPIAKDREGNDFYAFHRCAKELVSTYRKSQGVPLDLQIPDLSFKEEIELILNILRHEVYRPKGLQLFLGPAIEVRNNRIVFDHQDIGVWKSITPKFKSQT